MFFIFFKHLKYKIGKLRLVNYILFSSFKPLRDDESLFVNFVFASLLEKKNKNELNLYLYILEIIQTFILCQLEPNTVNLK